LFHVLPALEQHTYSEDDVEEGGIKIKKTIKFCSIKWQFFWLKNFIFIPNPQFWMSEGSLNKGIKKYSPKPLVLNHVTSIA
jgi:hypothetical protein